MKEYEVNVRVLANSPENAAQAVYYIGVGTVTVIDPEDALGQRSRFEYSSEGYKYVDSECTPPTLEEYQEAMTEHTCGTGPTPVPCDVSGCDAPPRDYKAAEAHAKDLYHTLWGKAFSGRNYNKDEWMQLQTLLHDLGIEV